MRLFPIGTISSGADEGTIEGISYTLFEPNNGCRSNKVHNTYLTTFQEQTRLTRKKAAPYMSMSYAYSNIFDREYKQLEHFADDVEDALTSFHIVDFSRGRTPSYIASSAGVWTVGMDNTREFSATTNYKSNYGILWDGNGNWKMGTVSGLLLNASVQLDISTNNYGALAASSAGSNGIIYPVYEVYLSQNALSNFRTTGYVGDTAVNLTKDGGPIRQGTIGFISKYKVGK
jgi:hypothetical protein